MIIARKARDENHERVRVSEAVWVTDLEGQTMDIVDTTRF